jgi:hypothetical protein
MRTRPNPFVQRGEERARGSITSEIESGAKSAFEELTHA